MEKKNVIDWNEFFAECERERQHGDDVFRIALQRTEESYRELAVDQSKDDPIDYTRMANIIHGMRITDSFDLLWYILDKQGIVLNEIEKSILDVFGTLDRSCKPVIVK